MKKHLFLLSLFGLFTWQTGLFSSPRVSIPTMEEQGFTLLFDGKTFKGWEGNMDYFRIQDGAVVAGNLNKK